MANYQVAIIGSGPVGLTLANLLGQFGIRTLLIERNASTVSEPRAVSIDDESLRTMQAIGLADEVVSQIVPGYGSHYFSPSGRCFARVEPTGTPYGYPKRNAFRQPVLEAQLRTGLARFGLVTTRYRTTLERFSQTLELVELHLRDAEGGLNVVTCNYLVGCDGAGSAVREMIDSKLGGSTFNERWLILDLENNPNTTHHTKVFCNPARPCITLPGPNSTRRYEFKLLAGETDGDLLAPEKIAELLRTHGAFAYAVLRRKVVYCFHARVADKWRDGRVFLAGDAAHLMPPFAGQGMNSGLRDAHNLAWKLASVMRGQLAPSVLETYVTERRDHIWQMIRLALRMGQVIAPRNWLAGFATRSFFDVLSLWPKAHDYITQMKYKPSPRFHAGWQIGDDRGRASLVGRMLPQPRVFLPDDTSCLLDDVLGQGFALISFGIGAAVRLQSLSAPLWTQLGAVQVALNDPEGAHHGVLGVRVDDSDFVAALAPYDDTILLLRPDHYVAVGFRLEDEPQIAARFA